MKVTEPGLNTLIDNLNTLICEDSLLTRKERETLVLAVAAIGAMKARVGLKKGEAPAVARRENWQASVLAFRETGQNAFQCCFPDRGNQGAAGRLGGAVQGDFGYNSLVRPEHRLAP